MSDQPTVLLPEVLIFFSSFHFFDYFSYLFIHYGPVFILVLVCFYNSCFQVLFMSASSNTWSSLGLFPLIFVLNMGHISPFLLMSMNLLLPVVCS